MTERQIGYLASEQLLFLNPWKPIETDTTSLEGSGWYCPNCDGTKEYFRSLARLEGAKHQFMIQCAVCDHLVVVEMHAGESSEIETRYGGPNIDDFLRFLDQRSLEEG